MEWKVTNALNRDIERQNLNKILAEIRAAIDIRDATQTTVTTDGASIEDVVGKMVENNTESGIAVTYNYGNKVLDFAVSDFIIRLTGDITGEGEVSGLSGVSIATTIDPDLLGVPEAPIDNHFYWRWNGEWAMVNDTLATFADLKGTGFPAQHQHDDESIYELREFEVEPGELVVTNPAGEAGNPLFGLADLADTGVGTSPVQLITRDAKGRVEGTQDADTDDLPEGVTNLYFTDERAQDAVGATLTDTADIELDYVDATPAISATLTAAVHASLALADSSVQSIVAGTNVSVDNTDPQNPIVSATGGGGTGTVTSVSVAGGVGLDSSGSPITTTGTITLDLDAASQASLALADTSVQPGDNISTLTNDSGFVTSSGVTSVSGTAPIVSSGGATPAISITAATSGAAGSMSAADKTKLDAISGTNTGDQTLAGLGGVPTTRTISTTAPLTGGGDLSANRTLAISPASGSAAGSMSSADFTKLAGIASGATANTGTVTSVALSVPTGLSVAGTPITTTGTFTVTYAAGYQGYTSAEATKLSGIATGATAYTDSLARSAVVIDSIADADTTHAPSRNAVFDALALKADDSAVVHNTGAETVAGTKTWSGPQTFNGFNTHKLGINFDMTGAGAAVANTFSMDAGMAAYYLFRIGTSNRIQFGMSATNDLFCNTWDDAGVSQGTAWTTDNVTRITTFNVPIVSAGASFTGDIAVSHTGTVLTDFTSTNGGAVQFRLISTDSSNRRFLGQSSAGVSESQMNFGNGEIYFWGASTLNKLLHISSASVDPDEDNVKTCGTAALRWSAVYSVTPAAGDNSNKCATTAFVNNMVASGTYTPTLFNTTNVTASVPAVCQWSRVLNVVTVSGTLTIDPTTGATASLLGMSLPVASNFASQSQCGGTATAISIPSACIGIIADTVNDRASFQWVTTADVANRTYAFSFTYLVV